MVWMMFSLMLFAAVGLSSASPCREVRCGTIKVTQRIDSHRVLVQCCGGAGNCSAAFKGQEGICCGEVPNKTRRPKRNQMHEISTSDDLRADPRSLLLLSGPRILPASLPGVSISMPQHTEYDLCPTAGSQPVRARVLASRASDSVRFIVQALSTLTRGTWASWFPSLCSSCSYS